MTREKRSTIKEIRKITVGFVVQRWDARTEKFLGQEFVASDQVAYEDENGNPIEEDEPEYRPFEMVQSSEGR
jgi:hypothetical protein